MRHLQWLSRCLVLGALGAVGCSSGGDGAPPLEEMTLRDALMADPATIASMSDGARRSLATRLEDARAKEQDEEVHPGTPGAVTPAAEVRGVDADREAQGRDALVAGKVNDSRPDAVTVAPFADDAQKLPTADGAPALPPLEGTGAPSAAELRALHGDAGAIVAGLLRASGAQHVVRVVGWPAGAVALGDAVYVNAAWLEALDKGDADAASGGTRPPASFLPLSLRGNPYLTYATLEACVQDVSLRCGVCLQTGSCDAQPALSDFSSARDECAFLAGDPARPAELCALALLSIDTVATCVRNGSGCSVPATDNKSVDLAGASQFVGTMSCVSSLDGCLSGTKSSGVVTPDAGATAAAAPVATQGCKDPFSECASSCKGIDDACNSGSCSGNSSGSSCSNCNSCASCSSCSGSGGAGGSNGSSNCGGCSNTSSTGGTGGGGGGNGSGNCGKCQAAPPPAAPIGTILWLLAPLVSLLRFTRLAAKGRRA